MAKLLTDDLWTRIEPLIPPEPPKPRGGRPRIGARACLLGILFVLKTGIAWADLPAELGCGSGVTCWRRLREWTEAGAWPRLHEMLLAELRTAGLLEMDDVAVDGSHVRALKGGITLAPRRSIGPASAASIM